MNQSQEINELASALSKAQGEMQAAIKDKINFFKNPYADLGSVWDAARPVLSKNGLAVVQTTEMNNSDIIMVTTLIHSSGQWIKSFLPLILTKKDCQGIGSAITYLRRYSLSAIVGVVCDEDDDGESAVGRGKTTQNIKPEMPKEETCVNINDTIGNHEINTIQILLKQLDAESRKGFFSWIQNTFKVDNLQSLPKTSFQKCMASLTAKIESIKQQEKVPA